MIPADSQTAQRSVAPPGNDSGPDRAGDRLFLLPGDRPALRPLSTLWERSERGRPVSIAARVTTLTGHARLVELRPAAGGGLEYLPGRLALRWALECSGFDVEDSRALDPPGEGIARLQVLARPSDRRPLLLSTPALPRPGAPPPPPEPGGLAGGRVLDLGAGARGWRDCDPALAGRFDLVRCPDVLAQEDDPGELLARLFELTAPGGSVIVGTETTTDPTLADTLGFLPPSYRDTGRWRWAFGPVALERLTRRAGFVEQRRLSDPEPPSPDRRPPFAYFALRRR